MALIHSSTDLQKYLGKQPLPDGSHTHSPEHLVLRRHDNSGGGPGESLSATPSRLHVNESELLTLRMHLQYSELRCLKTNQNSEESEVRKKVTFIFLDVVDKQIMIMLPTLQPPEEILRGSFELILVIQEEQSFRRFSVL